MSTVTSRPDIPVPPSELGWRCPPGLEELGILCSTRISRVSMVVESCYLGWQALGTGRITVEGARHALQAGDITLVQPHTPIVLHADAPDARHLAVLVPRSAVVSALIDLSGGAVTTPPPIAVLRGPELDRAGLQFYLAVTRFDDARRARTAWRELLAQVLRLSLLRSATPRPDPPPVRRARDYLHDHPRERFTLDEIANHAGTSKHYLARLFRRTVGMSPQRYHRCVRAEQARILIDHGASPRQAALAAGFIDPSHFSRVFKLLYGVPPGRYANAAAKSRGNREAR
jgi:AraC-like DNA-binding protein